MFIAILMYACVDSANPYRGWTHSSSLFFIKGTNNLMNTFAHCFTQKNHHDNNETKYTQMQQQTKQTN